MTKLFQPRSIVIGPDPFSYDDQGFGPPVLFLHGALGDLRTWLPHVQALSAKFRCIAYTQRCFGTQSWRNDGPPFGVATHAYDLIAFVEALGLRPVSLVAWSYAGHVALHAALQRPDLFSHAHTMPLLLAQELPPLMTCEALGCLPMPVAVLWGEHSRPISKVPSQAVSRCIRHPRHGEVPGVGHLWPEENPDAFYACVARWLDEAAPSYVSVFDAENRQ